VRRICAKLAARGAQMLDAPVGGGPRGAASGRLAIWVGGDRSSFDRYKAVLDAIGDQASYVGPTTVAKLVHNWAAQSSKSFIASRRMINRCVSINGRAMSAGGLTPIREFRWCHTLSV
jgi:3-hydroxyisobutyrate dehydrogenase